jgi:hypothetical protein
MMARRWLRIIGVRRRHYWMGRTDVRRPVRCGDAEYSGCCDDKARRGVHNVLDRALLGQDLFRGGTRRVAGVVRSVNVVPPYSL